MLPNQIRNFRDWTLSKKIIGLAALGICLCGIGILFFFIAVLTFIRLPSSEEIQGLKHPIASELYSADSVLIGRFSLHHRQDVSLDEIDTTTIQTLLATEDIRFYQHGAVDVRSILRVIVKTILFQDEASGGGSTLSQQLVKNVYPRKHYPILSLPVNKVREIITAHRLEKSYTKGEIIELYLNTVSFGDNTFGIDAAARRFYSISAGELSIDQAAVLIGMLKATYTYNPRIFPDQALQRRNVVIGQLEKYDLISPDVKDSLSSLPIQLDYLESSYDLELAPYFKAYVEQELLAWCAAHTRENGNPYNLYSDGLKVYTTLDSRLQHYAEKAVAEHMPLLQRELESQWKDNDALLDEYVKRSTRYQTLLSQGLSGQEIMIEMSKPHTMSIFDWSGTKEVSMSPLDSIEHYLRMLNTGVLAMDPATGGIKAWVGGINYQYFPFDHVKETTRRQVGSTFKPVVYAAALEHGIDPCEYFSAEKTTYSNMEEWTPQNTAENYNKKFSLAGGLTHSVNTVSVRVLEKTGLQNAVNIGHAMGISANLPAVPSLALGTASVSVTEMVTAYACFANEGKRVSPYYLTAITTSGDSIIHSFERVQPVRALTKENAQLMVHMLKGVVEEGTAQSLRSVYHLPNDIGGKTGTTQSNADGWFISVTPNLVVGTWVGADDPRVHFQSTATGQGAHTALPIVAKFFGKMNQDHTLQALRNARFPELPPDLEEKLACPLSKSDLTLIETLFGKSDEAAVKAFGEEDAEEEKEGFFKRLFKRK